MVTFQPYLGFLLKVAKHRPSYQRRLVFQCVHMFCWRHFGTSIAELFSPKNGVFEEPRWGDVSGLMGYSCHGIPTDVSTTDLVKGGLFQLLHFLGGKTKKLGKDSEILVSSFGSKCVRIATLAHLEGFTPSKKCIEYGFLHHHSPLMKVLMKHFQRNKNLEFKSGFVSTRRFSHRSGLPVDPKAC